MDQWTSYAKGSGWCINGTLDVGKVSFDGHLVLLLTRSRLLQQTHPVQKAKETTVDGDS